MHACKTIISFINIFLQDMPSSGPENDSDDSLPDVTVSEPRHESPCHSMSNITYTEDEEKNVTDDQIDIWTAAKTSKNIEEIPGWSMFSMYIIVCYIESIKVGCYEHIKLIYILPVIYHNLN